MANMFLHEQKTQDTVLLQKHPLGPQTVMRHNVKQNIKNKMWA